MEEAADDAVERRCVLLIRVVVRRSETQPDQLLDSSHSRLTHGNVLDGIEILTLNRIRSLLPIMLSDKMNPDHEYC